MAKPSEQETGRPEPRAKRRRWFQFGLSTLLAVTALAAGGAMAWRLYVEPYRRQWEALVVIENLGGRYQKLFGKVTSVDMSSCDDPEAYLGHLAALPALHKLVVGGPVFDDPCLRRLHRLIGLHSVVLDSTSVSEDGLRALRKALPEIEVELTEYRAIGSLAPLVSWSGPDYWEDVDGLDFVYAEWYCYRFDRQVTDADLPVLLPKLRRVWGLDFRFARITDAGLAHVKEAVPGVRELDLSKNGITDAGLAHIKGLDRLEFLDLDGCRVSDAGLRDLAQLKKLATLFLPRTQVSDDGLASLSELGQLKKIWLGNTQVTDAGLVHLAKMNELEELFLMNTQVTDAGLVHLQGLNHLTLLALEGCAISDKGLRHLEGLHQLSVLRPGMQVTVAGVAELGRALPNCSIENPDGTWRRRR